MVAPLPSGTTCYNWMISAQSVHEIIIIIQKKVCFLLLFYQKMPYARNIRRSTVKRAARRTTRRAKFGTGAAKQSYGKASRNAQTARYPAFSYNLGDARHIDRPLVQGGAMPATLFTRHRYSEQLIIYADNLTGRTGSEVAFRMNSLWDPNLTGAGHQALGFDQMTPFYKRHVVYKVDCQVRVVGKFGTAVTFCAVNVRPSTSTYVLQGLKKGDEILEQPGNTLMDGAINQTWNSTYYIADVEGVSRQKIMIEDVYQETDAGFPSSCPYLSVAAGTWDEPASSTNGLYVVVSFVYHTRWDHLNPLPQS